MRRFLVILVGCLCAAATVASPALAGDANRVPPMIELTPAGQEGFIGPRAEALASFSTAEAGPGENSDAEYTKGSKVTFACFLDGRPTHCSADYLETTEGGFLLRTKSRPPGEKILPGPYYGSVSLPKHLATGPHTVTVVATDEDGTDPNPPSVTVTMDRKPPSAPVLTQKPPRRSRIHKPVFRFEASDDMRLVRKRGEIFIGSLRRVKPPGLVWKSSSFGGSFLSIWFPRCPTLLTCSTRAQADYEVSEGWYSYGEPEWLGPGLYEFRVRSWDAVRNKSPLTNYRFRILRGRSR